MRRRPPLLPLLAALSACAGDPPPSTMTPPTDPAALQQTLVDLAAFGDKHVGTDPDARAADYLEGRLRGLGLHDVHRERFGFPRHDVDRSTAGATAFTVTVDGAAVSPAIGFDVFEGSGAGHAAGKVVWVNTATDADLAGVDLHGKIAMVQRIRQFHRSSQYRNVAAHGAVAMLYLSVAPDNLRQVGSVRRGWEALGPIPTITIGAVDGKRLLDAVMAGHDLAATLDVAATATPATGTNLVGRIVGQDDAHQIVIGAHYDTWFAGSTDNGGGVAALLALAARLVKEPPPRYTLVFVLYDGEEVALYGGYDYLHKHRAVTRDPILAVLNFEVPSAKDSSLLGLARSNLAALDGALKGAGLGLIYPLYAGLELVPMLFGGIIPTDIQGIYRSGVPTASTAVDSPYYHTTQDTPDKVDTPMLAEAVDAFAGAVHALEADDPPAFEQHDPKLWTAVVRAAPRTAGAPIVVTATITDGSGVAQASAPVHAALLHDDFFEAAAADGTTDGSGNVTFTFDAAAAAMGSRDRFVHVTAGPVYPLVEQVIAVE